MFDPGFWELTVIAVLALLILGPERLPVVARKVGTWVGKARRYVSSVRSDIEREFRTDDLERMLNQQNSEIQELKNILADTQRTTETTLKETEAALQAPTENAAETPQLPETKAEDKKTDNS